MLDQDDIQQLFEDKYAEKLGIGYEQWLEEGPQTEDEAYAELKRIDEELKRTYDSWFEATGDTKDQLEEAREKLKAKYGLIEEMFGLELDD